MNNFKEWLKQSKIKNKDTIKGDFARDIISDPNFPDIDDKQKIYDYMERQTRRGGTSDALPEFKALYRYYLKQMKRD